MANAPATDADASVEKPKKGKLMMVLPVVALLLGGGGGYYQYQKATAPESVEEEETGPPKEYGVFTSLPGIIVNPAGTGGRRYLMVDVALEAAEEETIEEVNTREVPVRDAVVRLLSSLTVEELAAIEDRDALKDTLRASINEIVDGDIDRLYFTQFVLQ